MESKIKTAFNTRFPIIRKVDVTSLRDLAARLSPMNQRSFDKAYGNIRRLLGLEVQESALVAFSRFYDSEIRCFLFKNFQMAPTLEEYEKILGFGRSKVKPYRYQGHYYSDEKLASLLQVRVENLRSQKVKRQTVFGFPQEFFESLLNDCAAANDWGSFKQILALTIFGVILFPQIEKFIDETAIGVFLAFQDSENPVNPVPAVLAETYRAFTRHQEFQKDKMVCSVHVLYAWFIYHISINKGGGDDFLSHALGCHPKVMDSHEWVQTLEKLDGVQIHWFSPKYWEDKRPLVLFRCGDFQNVPLMGTQGCINYNPSLTLRQLGYPMRDSPSEAMLFRFYLHERAPKDESLFRRILRAWENVVLKGEEELRKRTTVTSFTQWLGGKISNARQFKNMPPLEGRMLEPYTPTIEELEGAKSALVKVEEEKRLLQDELRKMVQDQKRLEDENAIKVSIIEEANKELELKEKEKWRMQKHLTRAKEEVKKSTLKMNEALMKASEWKSLYEQSSKEERLLRGALTKSKHDFRMMKAELETQMKDLKRDRDTIESILKDYQQALRREQGRSESLENHIQYLEGSYLQLKKESHYWESQFADLVHRLKSHEVFEELKRESFYWKDRFSKLAWLANQAVVDVPRRLRKAESEMHPFNTPTKVYEFVRYCRSLTGELMEKAKEADQSKKRKRDEDSKAICVYRFP